MNKELLEKINKFVDDHEKWVFGDCEKDEFTDDPTEWLDDAIKLLREVVDDGKDESSKIYCAYCEDECCGTNEFDGKYLCDYCIVNDHFICPICKCSCGASMHGYDREDGRTVCSECQEKENSSK